MDLTLKLLAKQILARTGDQLFNGVLGVEGTIESIWFELNGAGSYPTEEFEDACISAWALLWEEKMREAGEWELPEDIIRRIPKDLLDRIKANLKEKSLFLLDIYEFRVDEQRKADRLRITSIIENRPPPPKTGADELDGYVREKMAKLAIDDLRVVYGTLWRTGSKECAPLVEYLKNLFAEIEKLEFSE